MFRRMATVPPADDAGISRGLATNMGQALVAVLAVTSAISAVLGGDNTPETIVTLVGAVLTAITVMAGRYLQAYAKIRNQATVVPAGVVEAGTVPAGAIVVHCCCCCSGAKPAEQTERAT
jgi:drug/metabolite transporter (DMT)-like permease